MHIFLAFFFMSTLLMLTTIFVNVTEAAVICGYGAGGVAKTIIVDQSGSGNFKTIQASIDSIPSTNNLWFIIQINAGIYVEKVRIPLDKPCIVLQGQGRTVTKITYYAHKRMDTSATFTSFPDNVVAKNITFENSYNLRETWREKRRVVKQAVAARVYGDKCAFYGCGFVGLQDTLWDVQNRHYFYHCYIEGAIDFIFGSGESLYEDCNINATVGSLPNPDGYGVITAQGRNSPNDHGGFVFLRGQVSSTGLTVLGRGYRLYSRVIFLQTNLLANIVPYGWQAWNGAGKEYCLTYAEEGCYGPGSNKSKRVPWEKNLTQSDLKKFSRHNFIDQNGWISLQP